MPLEPRPETCRRTVKLLPNLDPWVWIWLLLVPLSVALCLIPRVHNSLDMDEAVSVYYARLGWGAFWRAFGYDANMALYYVLLREWMAFGSSEFAIRLLSVLAAVAAVPAVYAPGATYGRRTGMIAALFFTLNAFVIQYARYARGDALVLRLVTLASLFYVRSVEQPTIGRWIGYVLTATLAIYTHFSQRWYLSPSGWRSSRRGPGRRLGGAWH
jgi:hypothetical protein